MAPGLTRRARAPPSSVVKMKSDEDKIKTLSPHLLMAYSGEPGASCSRSSPDGPHRASCWGLTPVLALLPRQATPFSLPSSWRGTSVCSTCGESSRGPCRGCSGRPADSRRRPLALLPARQHARRAPAASSSGLDPAVARNVAAVAAPVLGQPPPGRVRRPGPGARALLDRLPRYARDRAVRRARVRRLLCAQLSGRPLGGEHGPRARDRGPQDVPDRGPEACVAAPSSSPLVSSARR